MIDPTHKFKVGDEVIVVDTSYRGQESRRTLFRVSRCQRRRFGSARRQAPAHVPRSTQEMCRSPIREGPATAYSRRGHGSDTVARLAPRHPVRAVRAIRPTRWSSRRRGTYREVCAEAEP